MRIATPFFQLFTTPLLQAVEQGKMQTFNQAISKLDYMRNIKLQDNAIPMALRWNMHPEFGFPRKPFNVYRRLSNYSKMAITNLVSTPTPITVVNTKFNFPPGQEMYISAVAISLAAGQSISITPFDRDGKNMIGKSKTTTTSGSFIFKCPFIAGFIITGTGTINSIAGVSMQQILDATDWELIQIVGLPFKTGVINKQGYNGDNQGYVSALTDAVTASMQRLKIGELLFIKPPSVADVQVPDPAWQAVDSKLYLDDLFNANDSILKLIQNCLDNSDDLSYFRRQRQVAYKEKIIIKGIHQPSGLPPKDAEANIPVVGTTLLSVTTESPAALGLGFGTTDFISRNAFIGNNNVTSRVNAAAQSLGYDYMVTGQYTVRPFENIRPLPFLDDLSKQVEFCALSDDRILPIAPINPQVLSLRVNRPEVTDTIFTEAVKLRWAKTDLPQGYGLISNYKNGTSTVLNTEYKFFPKSYKNYNTYTPKNVSDNPSEQVNEDDNDSGKFVLVMPEEPIPFKGSEVHKYFIAGWDVFGRWSNFIPLNYVANAVKKQNPGVMSVRLSKTNPDDISDLSPINPNVTCKLELELGWNWVDRTPSKIQIAGLFFNAANDLPPQFQPNYFALTSVDNSSPIITISFDALGNPSTTLGTVNNIINTAETPTDLRKIKLVINNIIAAFPAGAPFAVAYAVYVRGLEKVRINPLPEDWGDWTKVFPSPLPADWATRNLGETKGYLSRMEDPRPPAATTLPATIQFTAMPDATKTGRGRLNWPTAANALGYYVWEASETAVRVVLDKKLKEQFPSDATKQLKPLTDSLVSRATQLRDLLAQAQYQILCQRAFNKLSKEMITTTFVELEIPASSKVLILYQVSSINTANIESVKSNIVFYAVPQIQKPAAPMLSLKKFKRNHPILPNTIIKGIKVQVLNGNGLLPVGFNLYKSRKLLVSNDVGSKGLPIKEFNHVDWQSFTMQMLDGANYNGKFIEEIIVNDNWRPYVYQVVAVGQQDTDKGFFRGESDPSSTAVMYYPPDNPPTLILGPLPVSNADTKVLLLSTNAPFEQIDKGKSFVELYSLDINNARTILKTFDATSVVISNTDLVPVSLAVANASWPAILRHPTNIGTGITVFSVGVKKSVTRVLVKIIDPLGRATEVVESV